MQEKSYPWIPHAIRYDESSGTLCVIISLDNWPPQVQWDFEAPDTSDVLISSPHVKLRLTKVEKTSRDHHAKESAEAATKSRFEYKQLCSGMQTNERVFVTRAYKKNEYLEFFLNVYKRKNRKWSILFFELS